MNLENKIRQICKQLVLQDFGWKTLIEEVSNGEVDITADDLDLLKPFNVNRSVKGFSGFSSSTAALVVPGLPEKSVLFHAFACPAVIENGKGKALISFPTPEDIETLENYIYASREFAQHNLDELINGTLTELMGDDDGDGTGDGT